MSEKCKEGKEYKCNHLNDCISDKSDSLSITDSTNPNLIYIRSKEWSKTTKTWAHQNAIYSCQPRCDRKSRNMDIIEKNIFYEQDISEIKKGLLNKIEKGLRDKLIELKEGK